MNAMRGRWRLAVVVLLSIIPVLVAAGLPVYVFPQVDKLRKADAIVVLGGPGLDRYEYGLELAREGYAPHLVFSNPLGENTPVTEVYVPCHTPQAGFTLECFEPDPVTTRGEAEEIGRLATERNWKTLIVVTFTPHISRARFIVAKCYSGELIMAPSPRELSFPQWAWMYVYQTAGYLRTLVERGC